MSYQRHSTQSDESTGQSKRARQSAGKTLFALRRLKKNLSGVYKMLDYVSQDFHQDAPTLTALHTRLNTSLMGLSKAKSYVTTRLSISECQNTVGKRRRKNKARSK